MANIKVFHVRIGELDAYFGSKKAIFDTFGKEEIGITYNSFRNIKNLDKIPFKNSKCVIKEGILIQTPTNRGKRTENNPIEE